VDNHYIFKLDEKIQINEIKKNLEKRIKTRPLNKCNFELEQEIVYTILHKFSNYETIMWSLYQNFSPNFIHKQFRHILLEISKLDTSLTWACMTIFDRYKSQYKSREKRSSYVVNTSINLEKVCK
tara:strand:- start:198 stop:572 length:375 start_codon:yes stop_codon:yes gene_type:complete